MAMGFADPRYAYDGAEYYREQERRYHEERQRQQMMAMQQSAYNPYTQQQQGVTDLQREQKAQADDRFTSNKKLLLLEN